MMKHEKQAPPVAPESRLNRRELDAADEPREPTLDEIDSQ